MKALLAGHVLRVTDPRSGVGCLRPVRLQFLFTCHEHRHLRAGSATGAPFAFNFCCFLALSTAVAGWIFLRRIHGATKPASAFLPIFLPATLAGNEKGGDKIAAVSSSCFLRQPIADLQELSYLASFVAVLEGFFGMMLGFAERMLGITDCFTHDF
jgi:hypothetical protein